MKLTTHRHWTVKIAAAMLLALFLLLPAPFSQAAPEASPPTELNADTITYTSQSGVMTAKGNVRLTQGKNTLTGNNGEYNTRTKEARVTGNAKLVQEGNTVTAEEIRSFDNMTKIVATENARLVHSNGTAAGDRMEYLTDRRYLSVTGGARLTSKDAVITAQSAEAFFNENRAVATGGVHIVSETRSLDAVADQAVYHGLDGKDGRADLTGNVRAVQDGNVLTGNHVVLYMDDRAMGADGRPSLVIQPRPAAPKDPSVQTTGEKSKP